MCYDNNFEHFKKEKKNWSLISKTDFKLYHEHIKDSRYARLSFWTLLKKIVRMAPHF